MSLDPIQLGSLTASKFILGSNPFSAFSHQGHDRDQAMRHYYTSARIKEAFRQAEALGVTTLIARGDHHVIRLLTEYWGEGGQLQWVTQTCPELGPIRNGVRNGLNNGAKAVFVHGGVMDHALANDKLDEVVDAVAMIKDAGLPAGVAGHNPNVFRWAEDHLDVDFYMCAYYNPIPRETNAAHVAGTEEMFLDEDRAAMTTLIGTLSKPVIHYKVMAAGRNEPRAAFAYVARHLRPQDAVCVGVFMRDNSEMIAEDVRLLEESLQQVSV